MNLNFRIFILLLFIISACGKHANTGKFNSKAWKADRYACLNQRRALLPDLQEIRPELVGITGGDALKIFGKPEATFLADQAEQIHYYYLAPGAQCQDPQTLAPGNKLMVRINGLGLVSEISFEEPLQK